jgi:hypothetical protein
LKQSASVAHPGSVDPPVPVVPPAPPVLLEVELVVEVVFPPAPPAAVVPDPLSVTTTPSHPTAANNAATTAPHRAPVQSILASEGRRGIASTANRLVSRGIDLRNGDVEYEGRGRDRRTRP